VAPPFFPLGFLALAAGGQYLAFFFLALSCFFSHLGTFFDVSQNHAIRRIFSHYLFDYCTDVHLVKIEPGFLFIFLYALANILDLF